MAHCKLSHGRSWPLGATRRGGSGASDAIVAGEQDATTRELLEPTSPTKKSADFVALLDLIDCHHGPKPGCQTKPGGQTKPVILVLARPRQRLGRCEQTDNGALAARPWRTVAWLPRHAPKLNAIARAWRDLKPRHLAHGTFEATDHLDQILHAAAAEMNSERMPSLPHDNLRIAA